MPHLNRNYITNRFKLPGAKALVILNGIYQPQLSATEMAPRLKEQTLILPPNFRSEEPLHLLFLTSANCQGTLNIIAEKNSYTTIIEEHASLGEQPRSSSMKINLLAKESSEILHYKLQDENAVKSVSQLDTRINQEQHSKVISNVINKGAKTSVDILQVKFSGEQAYYRMQGIDLLAASQVMSHKIMIEHLVPACSSNVLLKTIISDQATCNFDCKAIAYPGAIKTETHVTNKNLLLSELATINTSPELEVYVDDVICTHAATSGQLDHEALFYLRSRGLAKNRAVKLLTYAFMQEIIDQFAKYSRLKITAGLTDG